MTGHDPLIESILVLLFLAGFTAAICGVAILLIQWMPFNGVIQWGLKASVVLIWVTTMLLWLVSGNAGF